MWRVVLARSARKNLDNLPGIVRQRISAKLKQLSHTPYMGKKLKGELKGHYAVRVWPYRIIYALKRRQLVVLVVHIDHRQGVYK